MDKVLRNKIKYKNKSNNYLLDLLKSTDDEEKIIEVLKKRKLSDYDLMYLIQYTTKSFSHYN